MAGKVSSAIGGLKQIRHLINKEAAVTIHNSLILPLFDYCDTVWDTISSSLATRLQKLNNRAGRVISELGYEIRSSEIRNHLGWSTLQERRTGIIYNNNNNNLFNNPYCSVKLNYTV